MGPATSVAAKGDFSTSSNGGMGTFIPSAIWGERPLCLAGMCLGLKCLAGGSAHGFACNGPDVGVLGFGFDRGLHHRFQSLALMRGCASLQYTIIGEVTTKHCNKTRVKAINEDLADADGEWILVNEWTRSSQDLRIVIEDRLKDGAALRC